MDGYARTWFQRSKVEIATLGDGRFLRWNAATEEHEYSEVEIDGISGLTEALESRAPLAGWDDSRVMVSDAEGRISASSITTTLLGYLAGLTGAIQGQLDAKASSTHSHAQSDVTGLATALAGKADLVDGVLATSQIPAVAISEFLGPAADEEEMLGLEGERGDYCYRTDIEAAFWLTADDPSEPENWLQVAIPTVSVQSVNSQTGIVVLGFADVGAAAASHSHEQSDVTGLASALAGKSDTGHTHTKSGITDLETITVTPTNGAVPKGDGSGKIADGWLSSNVPLKNAANTFTNTLTAAQLWAGRTEYQAIVNCITTTGRAEIVFAESSTAKVSLGYRASANGTNPNEFWFNASSATGAPIKFFVSWSGTPALMIDAATGNVAIKSSSATAPLDINGDTIRLRTAKTPESASATGNAGEICWDSSYLYICTATNTWRRIAHSTW
ncbi:hypothetical protein SH661x_001935 [Planctomicrobium sp. SH661]|uniref:hypothetical protein n=1 Tax=Planctomicrobium sp. SH661 TaxID=3448124 RepID=UPI003F5C5179